MRLHARLLLSCLACLFAACVDDPDLPPAEEPVADDAVFAETVATLHADGMFAGKIPGALEDNARAVMELLLSSVLRAAPGRRSGAAPLHGTKRQDTPPIPIR